MVVLQWISSKEDISFINERIKEYPEIDVFEVDSLSLEPIIQVVIPITAILAPVVSAIISKIIDNKRVTIKYNNIEITASSYEEAKKIINDIAQGRIQ